MTAGFKSVMAVILTIIMEKLQHIAGSMLAK
jgi:hypothetical protein